ncbi:hypothetical protein [Paenibacillus sp. Pae108]|uniref:hypothetical protein n=1 Tax=Paenibacillus sp. Pae108 TaxID=2926019 RepID=UPI0021175508|nr:hypothetical protein [Paenibacillus sp. Pae108]
MNNKSLQIKRYEMKSIWDSFEWLLKEKLIGLDNNARAINYEMRTMGVPENMAEAFVAEQFKRLSQEVIAEQRAKYDGSER